jgi:peroxiredoxin
MPVDAILMECTCSCSGAMALTPSTMLPLGTDLPDFQLPTINGGSLNRAALDQNPVLMMVICAHCPFVKHIEPELTRLDRDYRGRIQLLAVSSNSLITHPQDGADQLMEQAERQGWSFPYLMDQDQTLARSLRAACTPEFYLFAGDEGSSQTLRYRGQLDGSRPGNDQPLDGSDLRQALNAVLTGEPVNPDQIPSVGCNVKWHPGLEPDWFG